MRDPPLQRSEWSEREIRTAADKLGVRELISRLMTDGDAEILPRLDFIYHLFAISSSRSLTISQWKACSPSRVTCQRRNDRPAVSIRKSAVQPNAPILPTTRHLIVEGQPAHSFLYALYGELADSQLLVFPQPMSHNFDGPLAYVQRSVTPAVETLTL